jgi:hypothetical protein
MPNPPPRPKQKGGFQKLVKKFTNNKLLFYPSMLAVILLSLSWIFPWFTMSNLSMYLEQLSMEQLTSSKLPPPLRADISISSHGVSKLQWNHSESPRTIVQGIVDAGRPVLIRGGPASYWPISNWDVLEFLRGGNDIVMEGVRWQREPVFVLGRDREKGGMLGSSRDRPLLYINSTMASFLKTVFNTSQYFYWSGELQSLEGVTGFLSTQPLPSSSSPEGIPVNKLDWKVFRHVDSGLSDSIELGDDELWVPMVWFSHPGVVAQTHFDPQHNFLSQLQGKKRVILFPPSEQSMYLYPHIHRSYRQSQLHLEKGAQDASRFPSLPTSGMEVILKPGDSLYIPPYWHHRVESLTMAMSISVTSPAHLEAAFSEISWQTVPFGKFASLKGGKAVAVKLYLGLLLSSLQEVQCIGDMNLESFSKYLYSSRYAALYPPDKLDSTRPGGFLCPRFPKEGTELHVAVQDSSGDFSAAAKKIAGLLDKVEAPVQLRREFLGDYVEELVRWAVGPANVVFFIHDCLR